MTFHWISMITCRAVFQRTCINASFYTTSREYHREKSISDEWNITFHVIASQLSGHCDVTSNRLWRHQKNVSWASEAPRRCVKIVVFIVTYEFVMSCKTQNQVYYLKANCLGAHSSDTFVSTSIVVGHKEFATRVHTLFYKQKSADKVCVRDSLHQLNHMPLGDAAVVSS